MTGWSVYIELDAPEPDEATTDALHAHMSGQHAAVGTAPSGRLAIQLSADARTARQAITAALRHVTEAAAALGLPTTVLGVELLTEAEQERRQTQPPVPDLAGNSEAADILGVDRSRVSQLAASDPNFPRPLAQLRTGPVYPAGAVRAYAATRDRSRGRRPKPVDLTAAERALLDALAAGPGLPPAPDGPLPHLNIHSHHTPGAVRVTGLDDEQATQAMTGLIAAGLVARVPRTRKTEGTVVALTKRGERIARGTERPLRPESDHECGT